MNNREKNCKILGLDVNCKIEDIKKTYKKLALQYHPDKCNESSEKFIKIQQAYDELINEKEFINTRYYESNTYTNTYTNTKNKVKNTFYECKISLKDVYFQSIKKYNIKKTYICKNCHILCNHCRGYGYVKDHLKIGPFVQVFQQNCYNCSNNGVILNLKQNCSCDKGNIHEEKIINIKIDYNVYSGKQIIIENWGEQPTRIDDLPGDLVLTLYILDDENFKRINNDLLYNCKITLKEALVGKIITIPHFEEPIILNISGFGIINYKKQYTIYGKGISNGDLNIIFDIIFPDKKLNTEEINKLTDVLNTIKLN